MPPLRTRLGLVVAACVLYVLPARTAGPVQYAITLPEPQHRWMQVDATFPDLTTGPLELRMSRSSPGRYSLHDFAKNVYDVHAFDPDGRELPTARPDPYGWSVASHGSTVRVSYKVYGDRLDGTYLAIDETHAHINMPAAIMWARGLDDRPVTISFTPPAGTAWQVATQLQAGTGAFHYSAPNLQYLMDSPTELGPLAWRQFPVGSRTFRVAVHHLGTDADLDAFVADVGRIVREEGAIFGEFPAYEPGHYTFIADYLPSGHDDGMEHRNSAVLTSEAGFAAHRADLLEGAAHEFFHSWNVERIRPRSLEPFDFERANISADLWVAEGFTQYYGPLVLRRTGLRDLGEFVGDLTELVDQFNGASLARMRTIPQLSEMAAFIDLGRAIDRTNWSTTAPSYYPMGAAMALALDLELRSRSDGRTTLDDFMRELWVRFGRPEGRPGYVARPYTSADLEDTLAEVCGDHAFAGAFFARYIQGVDTPDFPRLLGQAGLTVRRRFPGKAWLGDLAFVPGRPQVQSLVGSGWPVYAAGIEQDHVIERVAGQPLRSGADLELALARHTPGDQIEITFIDRAGRSRTSRVTLVEDPHLEVVPVEQTGVPLDPAQQRFRDRWLGPRG